MCEWKLKMWAKKPKNFQSGQFRPYSSEILALELIIERSINSPLFDVNLVTVLHTGILDRISFQPLLIHAQGCHGCQKKRNCKGFTKSLVWCAVFHSKLRKVQKTSKQHKKWLFFKTFFDFSPFWLKNSAPNQKFWNPLSILLLLTPITSLGIEE